MWQPHRKTTAVTFGENNRFLLRPVMPIDRDFLLSGFAATSSETRRNRFLTYTNILTEQNLHRILNADQEEHVAMGVLDLAGDDLMPTPVALVRYQRLLRDPAVAEFGITVVDDYQGQGLGKILISAIVAEAARKGIKELICYSLMENGAMAKLMTDKGASGHMETGGIMEYRLNISPSALPIDLALKAEGYDVTAMRA